MPFEHLPHTPACRSAVLAAAMLFGVATAAAQTPASPPRGSPDLSTLDLEQLMQVEVVVAGAKRAQRTRDVPSFVSVITAADIREHGYRTLADALKTLPSFYVTNDRNYVVVGVRGFARPGDYSSRVLLLLNGLRTNDNLYDQAPIGQEFIVDVDLIERIEVIRGPSAAIYGSNAFFAVINVVTRQGREMNGGEVTVNAASFDTYGGRLSYGTSVGADIDLLVSGSYSDSKGQRLYFPEFDDPSTNNGFADDADDESSRKLLATLTKGNFSLQASNVWRKKGIPTAAFNTIFNDNRTRTADGLTLASLTYSRAFAHDASFSARAHAGRWTYLGSYSFADLFDPNQDDDVGEWWGVDVDAGRPLFSRHFLTVGAEYRNNTKQDQLNSDPETGAVFTDLQKSSVQLGLFAQDEIKLFDQLVLHAGVRYDRSEIFGSATSPRVGLIYNSGTGTTLKLLAGRAFRAPNEFELYYDTDLYKANPALQPERIETLELVAQRFIGGGLQLTAAAFHNRLTSLINQRVDASDNDQLMFDNAGEIHSNGIELGLAVNRGHGATGQVTYSLQKSDDRETGIELTNSPRHMGKVQFRVPLHGNALSAGIDAQYMSALKTLGGNEAKSYLVSNLSLLAPGAFNRVTLSATVYNVFGVRYGNPGSDEHRQDIIQQDGRSFRVKTTVNF